MYEAGVAEIYDYSMTGPDPLRELIQHFGLQTIPMDAEQVQLDGELLNDVPGMRRKYGAKTADAIEAFRKTCSEMVTPIEYYEGVGSHDNEHPWAYHHLRGSARQGSCRPDRETLLQGDGALGHRDRSPQHQRAQCAEELRDGYRRLYRPLFHPERQRAADRLPALRGRRQHPAQSSCAQGRQERVRPLPPQDDERQGAGDARLRSRAGVPAAFLARDHGLGRRRAAQVDGQARRLFRQARTLSARFDPVRRAVLGREDSRRLVHVGGVRRLLRLQRGLAPRRRQAWRAELADRGLRCAGLRQSRRSAADRRRTEIAAGVVR